MGCARDEPCELQARYWAKHVRLAAVVVTLVAGIPGALATISFVAHYFQTEPPTTERTEIPERAPRPGPGHCSPYHAFRDGQCRDVR
jgi:hypothetical protein